MTTTPHAPSSDIWLTQACEVVVRQQEALERCLAAAAKPATSETIISIPVLQDIAPQGRATPDVPLVLGHLQAAMKSLGTALASQGIAVFTSGSIDVRLAPQGGRITLPEPIQEAWKRTKVAAICLVEDHGTSEQARRLHAARVKWPVGGTIVVVNPVGPRRTWADRLMGAKEAAANAPKPVGAATRGRRAVLVVDDEADIRDSLSMFLSKHLPGMDIVTAASGPEALQELSDRPVALIISDLRMPVMDGISFLEKARDMKPEAGRFLLTAYPGPDVETQAREQAGVETVLRKPASLPELVSILSQVEKRLLEGRS